MDVVVGAYCTLKVISTCLRLPKIASNTLPLVRIKNKLRIDPVAVIAHSHYISEVHSALLVHDATELIERELDSSLNLLAFHSEWS